jgi:hypothetical protein
MGRAEASNIQRVLQFREFNSRAEFCGNLLLPSQKMYL